jgi:hypothetical protein
MEETNKIRLQYIYTWKCHKETPCIVILKKQKGHFLFFFFLYKIREQESRTGPAGGVSSGRNGEREGKS